MLALQTFWQIVARYRQLALRLDGLKDRR